MHPMYREGLLRRKMGPIIVNKSNSQDRLIQELQGKLGIGRVERRRKQQPDDWLTEGVIVMSNPQRTREEGVRPSVDKVDLRGTYPVYSELNLEQHHVTIGLNIFKNLTGKCLMTFK